MKVVYVKGSLQLVPESKLEQAHLAETYAKGYAHFVCKYLEYADEGRLAKHNEVRSLRLAPSLIEWSRPESKYDRRRRRKS